MAKVVLKIGRLEQTCPSRHCQMLHAPQAAVARRCCLVLLYPKLIASFFQIWVNSVEEIYKWSDYSPGIEHVQN